MCLANHSVAALPVNPNPTSLCDIYLTRRAERPKLSSVIGVMATAPGGHMKKSFVHLVEPRRTSMWRSRWAAFGAAVAVSLGAGGVLVSQAAPGAEESTIVNVAPERILDTRDDLGLAGPFVSTVSRKLAVTGAVPTATGTKTVVPTGSTGVILNVTAVRPSANGFISVRPGDATGTPTTSSLNVTAGSNVPNAVQVAVPTAGANTGTIDIVYSAAGVTGPMTDILVDVVGYTTNTGLQELVADVVDLQADRPFTLETRVNSVIPPDGDPFIAASVDLPNNQKPLTVVVNSTTNVFNQSAGTGITCSIRVQGPVSVFPPAIDEDYSQRWESPGADGGLTQLSGTRRIEVPVGGGSIGDIALICRDPSEASVLEDIVLTAVAIVD